MIVNELITYHVNNEKKYKKDWKRHEKAVARSEKDWKRHERDLKEYNKTKAEKKKEWDRLTKWAKSQGFKG